MTKTTLRGLAAALTFTTAIGLAGTAQAGDHSPAAQAFANIFQSIGEAISQAQQNRIYQQQQQQQQEQYQPQPQHGTFGRARPGNGQIGALPVNGHQLQQLLAGNSVTGFLEDGTHFCEFYDYNGQIRGVDFEYYTGAWSVSGPLVYYDYPGFADDGAYQVAASYNSPWVHFSEQNGYQPFHNTRIHRGNVCGT